jgi:hypothetical protein
VRLGDVLSQVAGIDQGIEGDAMHAGRQRVGLDDIDKGRATARA